MGKDDGMKKDTMSKDGMKKDDAMAKHGHADAEDLPGADVSVGNFSVANEVVEGLQSLS